MKIMYFLTRYSAFLEAVIIIYRALHSNFHCVHPPIQCEKTCQFLENGTLHVHSRLKLMHVRTIILWVHIAGLIIL